MCIELPTAFLAFVVNVSAGVVVALVSLYLADRHRRKVELRRILNMLKIEVDENKDIIEESVKEIKADLERLSNGKEPLFLSLAPLKDDGWNFFKSSGYASLIDEQILATLKDFYIFVRFLNSAINRFHDYQVFRIYLPRYREGKQVIEKTLLSNLELGEMKRRNLSEKLRNLERLG